MTDTTQNDEQARIDAIEGLLSWCAKDIREEHLAGGEGRVQAWLDRLQTRAEAVVATGGARALNLGDPSALGRLIEAGNAKPGHRTWTPWMLAQAGIETLIGCGANPLQGFGVLWHTKNTTQVHSLLEAMGNAEGGITSYRSRFGGTALHELVMAKRPSDLVVLFSEPRASLWMTDDLLKATDEDGDTAAHHLWRAVDAVHESMSEPERVRHYSKLSAAAKLLGSFGSTRWALLEMPGACGRILADLVVSGMEKSQWPADKIGDGQIQAQAMACVEKHRLDHGTASAVAAVSRLSRF